MHRFGTKIISCKKEKIGVIRLNERVSMFLSKHLYTYQVIGTAIMHNMKALTLLFN